MKKITNFFIIYCFTTSLIFAQHTSKKISTAAINVGILKKEFIIPNLNTISHKIWVYLPPNYTETSKKYPVIYMHDAQNLFNNTTSYIGEWEVDETLNNLFEKTGKGFIVVAVENGGNERINEYTPWRNKKYGGGKGVIYIDFIVNTLKPYVDAHYRTKKQAKYTSLIGSSLGGLISYYGGLKYPKTFGKIGALSTSFWFSNKVIDFTKKYGTTSKIKLYLYVGGKEGDSMDSDTKNMKNLLIATGFPSKNITVSINLQGKHNETAWKNEFLKVVSWLYNK
ncbi:MAG: alpha/beta hydrolase-fold protein [Lutibacter sp.]|uniref:alpha/beta hydrolase n=1 Tax=Lutibacter sp. TaxID=1925666 RepID=UPI00385C6619